MNACHTRGMEGSAKRTLGSRGVAVAAAACMALGGCSASPPARPASAPVEQTPPSAQGPNWSPGADSSETTQAYVTRFYPRFFTDTLQRFGPPNRIVGPDRMGPAFGIVVAPNDDTLYAQFRLDLSQGAEILTIPPTTAHYSILTLDVFGDVLHTSIPSDVPGSYALVLPGFQGSLPPGVTPVTVPYPVTQWTLRADRYSSGANSEAEAERFRESLQIQSLAGYKPASTSGHTQILPLVLYSLQTKTLADDLVRQHPVQFLTSLQSAMHSATTAPLTRDDTVLSSAFDAYLATAQKKAATGSPQALDVMARATQTAHADIIKDWLTHTVQGNWVYFDNIGSWGTAYLDRAATAEFLLFGNNVSTAKYFDAFNDSTGAELTGAGDHAYRLTFPADAIPRAKRFWSLTAYIPPGITLVPNAAMKYAVASYTPGLRTNPDGSITVYLQHNPPADPAQTPNWLPVPQGPFSVILRIYAGDGNTASATYAPPGVTPGHAA
jgi:hypothetical protein